MNNPPPHPGKREFIANFKATLRLENAIGREPDRSSRPNVGESSVLARVRDLPQRPDPPDPSEWLVGTYELNDFISQVAQVLEAETLEVTLVADDRELNP